MTDKTPPSVQETGAAPSDAEAETPREHETAAAPGQAGPSEQAPDGHGDPAEGAEKGGHGESDGTGTAARPDGHGGDGRPVIEVSPGVHKRLTTGLGGFTMALGACVLLVLAIYVVTPRGDEQVLPTVDYGSHLWAMSNDAPFTVYAPEGLPAGWRPTSSRMHGLGEGGGKPVAWHLGFVTPRDEYAALEQSNEKASEYVPRMTNSSTPIGTQQVGGETWKRYHRKDKKANSLARTLPDGTSIVVTGTASYEELAVLAASLKPQAKGKVSLTPSTRATPRS